jgi:hypothetical protein
MSWLRIVYLAILAGWSWSTVAAGSRPASPLVWDSTDKTNTPKLGEVTTHFTFKVKNISTNAVTIDDLISSCGCTVAQLPSKPWRLGPGETNKFDVLMDLRDKPIGTLLRQINVVSKQAPDTLLLTVDIQAGGAQLTKEQEDRIWGQELAATDHQAVFKQDCARCHLVPAFGKTGQPLYQAACAICHEDAQRAPMVPDLHALKTEIDTTYWRNWVTHGKAGTLMPGFAAAEGGPLEDAQINSLVDYLLKAFPRPIRAANAPHEDTHD